MISKREGFELGKALAATALAFGIIIWREGNSLLFSVLTAAFTVGAGFILHELAHRVVATRYGKHAEFKSNPQMLIIMMIMSLFLGIIVAAPGAVMISVPVSREESGKIAAAGPIANLALAVLFLFLLPFMTQVAYYGFMINSLLGLFNMIPLPAFDGSKVLAWSRKAFVLILMSAFALNIVNLVILKLLA